MTTPETSALPAGALPQNQMQVLLQGAAPAAKSHWETYKRLYLSIMVFVSIWTAAAVVVFGSMTPEQLNALTGRALLLCHVKCWALASANVVTFLTAPQKPTTTTSSST